MSHKYASSYCTLTDTDKLSYRRRTSLNAKMFELFTVSVRHLNRMQCGSGS